MFLFTVLLIVMALGGAVLLIQVLGAHKKQSQILIDLGLERNFSGEEKAVFYKWGWRKIPAERIWGERIVTEAFRKANVWISLDDLKYFEKICHLHEKGKWIDVENVKSRVKSIVSRMDALRLTVASRVRDLLYN